MESDYEERARPLKEVITTWMDEIIRQEDDFMSETWGASLGAWFE